MTKKKSVNWKVVCTGLICITGLGAYAISQGINGTVFTIVVAIIAGAIGISVENPFKVK